MSRPMSSTLTTLAAIAGMAFVAAGGCSKTIYPHTLVWPATGDVVPTHAKPPEGGYYTNWDPYAAEVTLEPARAINPVGTQHVLVATVKDREGNPLPNRRVEWIVSQGSVGDIVEVDESGFRASRGYKLTNSYAVSHTNNGPHVLDRGTDSPDDDIPLTKGQTFCVITSPIEGTTHVIAYVPAIYDTSKHKAFARKTWMDVAWELPPPAVNPTGTDHELVTKVMRHSDRSPLANYIVSVKLLSGPGGTFSPANEVRTDADGIARVVLRQTRPEEGENKIEIRIDRPADDRCCKPGELITIGETTKRWIAPKIGITKTAPARAMVSEQFAYQITVSNPGTIATRDVIVTDSLPSGIEYLSSTPASTSAGSALSWSLGTLEPGASRSITVQVRATRTGSFQNCADVRAEQGLNARACADTVVVAPNLAMSLTCADAIICEPVTVQVTVRNTGDGPAGDVRVTLRFPPGLTTEDGRSEMGFRPIELVANQTAQFSLRLKASQPGSFRVTGTATGSPNLSTAAECESRVSQPALSVSKSGPQTRYVGRPATYEITVRNTGGIPARDVVVSDLVPPGMTAREAGDGGQISGGAVRWSIGTLDAGATRAVSVTLLPTQLGVAKNVVTATAFCAEARAEFETQVMGAPGVLLELYDSDDPVEVGNRTTYDVRITNQGMIEIRNMALVCEIPDEEEYVGDSGPTKGSLSGRTLTFPPVPSIGPRQVVSFKVTVKGVRVGDARFKVSVTTDLNPGSPIEEFESTHIYE